MIHLDGQCTKCGSEQAGTFDPIKEERLACWYCEEVLIEAGVVQMPPSAEIFVTFNGDALDTPEPEIRVDGNGVPYLFVSTAFEAGGSEHLFEIEVRTPKEEE